MKRNCVLLLPSPLSSWCHICVCVCSVAKSYLTLCDPMDCSMPGFPVLHSLQEFAQIHVHWVSDAIEPSHALPSPSPPALNLSKHQVFSNELALCIRWLKYWSFSFSSSPSNEHSGWISIRINRFDLLAAQGILKSLLQHHNLKAILWCWMVCLGNEPRSFGRFWDCT